MKTDATGHEQWNRTFSVNNNFTIISMKDILQSTKKSSDDFSWLKNKIILIGVSAPELYDLINTPITKNLPGVMVHASVISNILDKDYLQVINKNQILIYMFIASIITCAMVCYPKSRLKKILIPVIFYLLVLSLFVYLFKYNLVFKIVIPSLCVAVSWYISFLLSSKQSKKSF